MVSNGASMCQVKGFTGGSVVESSCSAGAAEDSRVQSLDQEDPLEGFIATHFQHSCLQNPMDRGASQATVHRITKSQT